MPTTSTGSLSPRSAAATHPAVPDRADTVRAALARLGVRPSRALGQSFLTDSFAADAEAALVETAPGRPVVEIGGGLGVLTAALLARRVGPLSVVEKDLRLAAHLRDTFASEIEVIDGDARTVPLPPADAVVGNLPFSVGTPIVARLVAARIPRIVVLLQDEVAQRFAAAPGSRRYGRPSIFARLYGEVELFRPVPPESFTPRPEVAGRIVRFDARPGPLPVPSVPEFERIVRTLFASRRKQLANLLPRVAGDPTRAAAAAERAAWPSDWARRRPEELPPEAFFALATVLARGRHRRTPEA